VTGQAQRGGVLPQPGGCNFSAGFRYAVACCAGPCHPHYQHTRPRPGNVMCCIVLCCVVQVAINQRNSLTLYLCRSEYKKLVVLCCVVQV
jgi:hypothetical protein